MPDDLDAQLQSLRDRAAVMAWLARSFRRSGADEERAVRMAEDFDAAMHSISTSAGTAAEGADALKASILALNPAEVREYEEWARRHPIRHALARDDARMEEVRIAIGTPLLHLLQRLGIMRKP